MKKALTRGEKWLFGAPLLFLVIAGAAWQWRKASSDSLEISDAKSVQTLEFSPDGKRLAVLFSKSEVGLHSSRVYDSQSFAPICDLAMPPHFKGQTPGIYTTVGYYYWFAWSDDGKSIVGSTHDDIALWDAQSGAVIADYANASPRGKIRFSSDGQKLIGEGVPPVVYNAATGNRLNQPDASISQDIQAKLSQNGRWLAMNDWKSKRLRVADYRTRKALWQPEVMPQAEFDWSGDVLCVQSKEQSGDKKRSSRVGLLLWNGKTRQQLPSPPIAEATDNSGFQFNPSQKRVAYINGFSNRLDTAPSAKNSGAKCEVVTWDYSANRVLWRAYSDAEFYKPQWSPDGKWLAVLINPSGNLCHLRVFDQSGQLRYQHENVVDVRWSPDSKQLAMVLSRQIFFFPSVSNSIEIHRFAE